MSEQAICLTMIVKDEEHVIGRCLESARPLVNRWCIVDTGSTDQTKQKIKTLLSGVPGELHERPWVDFGHNRTEAIGLAQGVADYLFFLDADEVVEAPPGFSMPILTADAYSLQLGHGDVRYWRQVVVATRLNWRFEGVLHEYLTSDGGYTHEKLPGPLIVGYYDGGRSKGKPAHEKYRRDAEVLEQALEKDPTDARSVFYLAQSYRDCGEVDKSLDTYRRRVAMGGWDEEVWYALYQIAVLEERKGAEMPLINASYLAAYQFRPQRAEPLVQLARFHRERNEHALAFVYASRAIDIPFPHDLLFLDQSCYSWRALDEYSIAAFYIGNLAESERACRLLLDNPALPVSEIERVRRNLEFAVRKTQ